MSNDTKSAGPKSPSDAKIEVHPGWVRSGQDNTPDRKAYYINLEAKPGNGERWNSSYGTFWPALSRNQVLAPGLALGSPTPPLESLKRFLTLLHETRMTSAQAARTSSVRQNWKRCWLIPRTSIASMSCSENSVPCSERRLPEKDAVDC